MTSQRRALAKLLSIASDAFASEAPDVHGLPPGTSDSLIDLLRARNGFLAFESALLVLPSVRVGHLPSITEWNLAGSWRARYSGASDRVFFAMDVFGQPFGVNASGVVCRLHPETGEITELASSLEGWADLVLRDYDHETGWSAGRKWQLEQGRLELGSRLLPKQPFVLGGEYAAANLVAVPLTAVMPEYLRLFEQVRDLPDGTSAVIKHWLASTRAFKH